MTKITGVTTLDLRFPSKDGLDGSDAMNPDPVYSAAYIARIASVKRVIDSPAAIRIGHR